MFETIENDTWTLCFTSVHVASCGGECKPFTVAPQNVAKFMSISPSQFHVYNAYRMTEDV